MARATETAGRDDLEAELAQARAQLTLARIDQAELKARLLALEQEHRRIVGELVAASDRAGELVLQHAALRQIHGAGGREELLQAVQEIVINVIGSEELAVFEREGEALRLVRAFGVEPGPLAVVRDGEGPLGRAASAGARWVTAWDGPFPGDPRLTAFVPLLEAGRQVGAIAVWRMLDHKPAPLESDREVFDLLAFHAGRALWRTRAEGAA